MPNHIFSSAGPFFKNNYKLFILLLLSVALIIRTILFITSIDQLPITSDEATVLLLADEISKGFRPLLFTGQPYQFPVESYLISPFIEWLPRNGLGIRYQAYIMECFVLIFSIFLIFQFMKKRDCWWPLLLLCFPSGYWLIFTFAYTPPQYTISIFLAASSVLTVYKAQNTSKVPFIYFSLTGLFCGIMLSNHLLTLSITLAILVYIFFDGSSFLSGLQKLFFFFIGLISGLAPYLLAITRVDGAYSNIPPMFPLSEVFSEKTFLTLSGTIGRAMGFSFPIFPDFKFSAVKSPEILFITILSGYGIIVFLYTLQRLFSAAKELLTGKWPECNLGDLAVIVSFVTIGMFATHQNDSSNCRYVIFVVFAMPFLVGQIFQKSFPLLQKITMVFVCCYALYNVCTYEKVFRDWRTPGEIQQLADTENIQSLLELLKQQGTTHCYASFWLSYRITYESQGNIICSQPFNERFPEWPTPYKKLVDKTEKAVYVLTNTPATRTSAEFFEKILEHQNISYQRTEKDSFFIYSQFLSHRSHVLEEIADDQYSTYFYSDRDNTRQEIKEIRNWTSPIKQHQHLAIEILFNSLEELAGIELIHKKGFENTPEISLSAYTEQNSSKTASPLIPVNSGIKDHFIINGDRLVKGTNYYIKHFEPAPANGIIIKIVAPNTDKPWEIEDIRLYRKRSIPNSELAVN